MLEDICIFKTTLILLTIINIKKLCLPSFFPIKNKKFINFKC